jgi:wyosine [tRNA(Phe)-imidazoG37] synthetase (radical SAM superfamily)
MGFRVMTQTPDSASSLGLQASVEAVDGLPSCIYGPVKSWRLGWSLGVDLLLNSSICSFNCVYCQLGDIQIKTAERKIYVPTDKVERDIRLSDWEKADVVTVSGNGEPTLASNLGEVLQFINEYTGKPTTVLTNATLLTQPAVRADLQYATHVACKIDAATDAVLQRMNRPVAGISFDQIIAGIQQLRAEYTGKLSLQCMFMPTNRDDFEALTQLIGGLEVDEIQLNTPKRPYPMNWLVENRGNHGEPITESRHLQTISEDEATQLEAWVQEATQGRIPLISIYR